MNLFNAFLWLLYALGACVWMAQGFPAAAVAHWFASILILGIEDE